MRCFLCGASNNTFMAPWVAIAALPNPHLQEPPVDHLAGGHL